MKTTIQKAIIAMLFLAGIHQATAQTSFLLSSNYPVGNGPNSVAAFKNVNGRVDVIVADTGDSSLMLLTNNGSGILSSNNILYAHGTPYSVVVADVNGDGFPDVICANNGSSYDGHTYSLTYSISIFTNNGSGGFGFSTNFDSEGSYPTSVAVFTNANGRVDLVCANYSSLSNNISFFTNNGAGVFNLAQLYTAGGNRYSDLRITVADINGDGKPDLLVAGQNTNYIFLLTNNGTGGFGNYTNLPVPGSGNVYPQSVAVFTNSSGKLNLVSANWGASVLAVFNNNGSANFSFNTNYPVAGPHWVVAADVNHDGYQDLICSADSGVFVLTNDETGAFVPAYTTSSVGGGQVVVADLNNDGQPDIITVNGNSPGYVSVLLNTSSPIMTSNLTNIVVTPANPSVTVGSNLQFTATEYFSDGSTQVVTNASSGFWSSSNPGSATITVTGIATGVSAGFDTITASYGSVSGSASLTVIATPAITSQPTNRIVSPNGSVTLSVSATGGGLSYQWRLNGTNIAGATGATFTIPNVNPANVGVYTVVVNNLAGTVTSQAAIVGTTSIQIFAGVIVNGPISSNYVIQASGSLTNWTTLTNLALPSSPYIFIDYNSPTNRQQFYQAVPQ